MTSIDPYKFNLELDTHKAKILVVDDNSTNLSVIVDYLEEKDFTTLIAKDGATCLKRARYAKPDIILLDILMPGIDGYETCLQLKSESETKDIPVIFMTALSSVEDKVKGFQVGAIDYVTKPIQPQEVLARIKLHLRLRLMSSTLSQQNQLLKAEITHRTEIEKKLQLLNDRLENKVEQRTIELKQTNQDLITEIQERKKAETVVRKSLQEKQLLLKEIHHRVKNNLLVVASLLDLQANYIEDENILKMFKNSENRIYSMALIHEQLYKFHDLKRLNLAIYIADLVDKLSSSHETNEKEISFMVDTDDVVINIETAHPCGLIINELIVNSLEHAFPEKNHSQGMIGLALKQDANGLISLSVKDNGIGLPIGFDPEESESLGLQLVYTLVEQLDGELKLDSSDGTNFQITFRELQYEARV